MSGDLFVSGRGHTSVKLQLIYSMIGRSPAIAAPTPSPEKPASLIGVSITRCGPNRSSIPLDTLYAPLYSATSSPMRKTDGSRSISSTMASRSAPLSSICGIMLCWWLVVRGQWLAVGGSGPVTAEPTTDDGQLTTNQAHFCNGYFSA